MKPTWLTLADSLQIPIEQSEILWQSIATYHNEPHRAYHNLRHLEMMFECLGDMVTAAVPTAVLLAVWFHDSVYNPQSQTNEEDSAVLMETLLRDWVNVPLLNESKRLILLTKSHQLEGNVDNNGRLLLDADLAILGSERALYHTYANAIRSEYAHVPDALYFPGRKAVLNHFLTMDTIYLTEYGRNHWEAPARQNLAWELSTL